MTILNGIECADWLLEKDRIVILTHRKPDGDTIGSAAGLCLGLRQLGKTAHILENPEITPLYAPLLEGLTKSEPDEEDLLIAVDVAADSMLPKAWDGLKNSIKLRIDHHGSGREYSPAEYVDGESAACAEMIWELLLDMGVTPDKRIAEAIYVGVSTDTGCFRFANTTAHSFDVAGDCTACGANIYEWNQKLFDTKSLPKLRLQSWIIANVQFLSQGRLAVCGIPKEVEDRLDVTEDDWTDTSSFLRSIEGVCMAALLRQSSPEYIKVSVRAIPGYDAAAVCEKFGGGGHTGAAGCSMKLSMDAAISAIGKAMIDWKQS